MDLTFNDPKRGAWLVYVGGLEIPCPSVTVSYGVGKIPEATLSFAPHRLLQRLGAEDRLDVEVFYLDTTADPLRPKFQILFEGEILGWSYANTPMGRQMRFDAIADISIWTQLYFFFMNTVDAVLGATVSQTFQQGENVAGSVNTAFAGGVFYPFSLFKKGLVFAKGKNPPADIDRPFEIMYNVVRGMMSDQVPPNQLSIPAVNFFSRWARKRNFQNRFAALPMFEDEPDENTGLFPVFKSVQADFVLKAMQDSLSTTVGEAGNILDVLKKLYGVALCEIAMIPTAPCMRVRLSDGTIIGPATSSPSSPQARAKEPLRLINYFVKPQLLFGIAPTCNVVFPSMIASYQYSENYWTQPTRMYVNDSLITGMLPQNTITSATLTFGYPPEVSAVLKARTGDLKDGASKRQVVANGKNMLVFPEELFKGPVLARLPIPSWFSLLQSRSKANAADQQADDEAKAAAQGYNEKLQKLYELYAQYEYFRARYEKRGGAVDMAFNPYPVPGFPCAVFDDRQSGLDTVGYVMNITHTLSNHRGTGSMRTSMQFSFGRTMQEMLEVLKGDMNRLGIVSGSAPAEPIDQVRAISQDFDKAEQFYNALFFGRQDTPNKKASFDFREVVGYPVQVGNTYDDTIVQPIYIYGTKTPGDVSYVPTGEPTQPPQHNVDGSRDLEPTRGFKDIFRSYDAAMQYVSRPICSLDEYIQFRHNETDVQTLIETGQVAGETNFYGYDGDSARYYTRIEKFIQGPGETPDPAALGAVSLPVPDGGTTPDGEAYTGPTFKPLDSKTTPQTRADWESVLEAYRAEILGDSPLR
jgi:hypothetical protein